jgi:hypothetical protein
MASFQDLFRKCMIDWREQHKCSVADPPEYKWQVLLLDSLDEYLSFYKNKIPGLI